MITGNSHQGKNFTTEALVQCINFLAHLNHVGLSVAVVAKNKTVLLASFSQKIQAFVDIEKKLACLMFNLKFRTCIEMGCRLDGSLCVSIVLHRVSELDGPIRNFFFCVFDVPIFVISIGRSSAVIEISFQKWFLVSNLFYPFKWRGGGYYTGISCSITITCIWLLPKLIIDLTYTNGEFMWQWLSLVILSSGHRSDQQSTMMKENSFWALSDTYINKEIQMLK